MFAVGDALLIRPLPVERPDQLVVLQWHSTEWPKIGEWGTSDDDNNSFSFSYPIYEQLAKTPGIDLAGSQHLRGAITLVKGEAGTAEAALVTGGFFRVLGVRPAAGRLFVDSDNSVASTPVVVISHRFWQNAFGGDPAAIGSAMRVNGQTLTIVGVTPGAFFGATPGQWTDLYVPACWVGALKPEMAADSPLTSDTFWWLELVGRLKPGASETAVTAVARREVRRHGQAAHHRAETERDVRHPAGRAGVRLRATGADQARHDPDVARGPRPAHRVLERRQPSSRPGRGPAEGSGAAALARRGPAAPGAATLDREPDAGAHQWGRRLPVRPLVLRGDVSLVPANAGMDLDLGFSWRVLAFALGISVAAGVLVGLAPAITLSRSSVAAAVRAGATVRTGWAGGSASAGRWWRCRSRCRCCCS